MGVQPKQLRRVGIRQCWPFQKSRILGCGYLTKLGHAISDQQKVQPVLKRNICRSRRLRWVLAADVAAEVVEGQAGVVVTAGQVVDIVAELLVGW